MKILVAIFFALSFRLLIAQDFPSALADKECIILDLSGSVEKENSNLIYKWDLGDGNEAYGITVEHCYDSIGEFQATLSIVDPISSMSFDDEFTETVQVLPAVALKVSQSQISNTYTLEAMLTGAKIDSVDFFWSWQENREVGQILSSMNRETKVRVLARFQFQGEEIYLSKEIVVGQ
ncbi:PKD domain-containing protein [Ekhidna sp.]|uniref:PKD domain-containing protein n=1 Tax=Ekhidna sp. TaxID=2608089 RepID=UPI003C7C253E